MSVENEMSIASQETEVPSGGVVDAGGGNSFRVSETIISVHDQPTNFSMNELKNFTSLHGALETSIFFRDPDGRPLIRRTPNKLGEIKNFESYFSPRVVAIGPLGHGDPSLEEGEKLKLALAAYFIKDHDLEMEILYSKIKMEISYLKKCYDPKEIEHYYDDDEKLAWMFFMDGCALLQAISLKHGPFHARRARGNEINIKDDMLVSIYLDFFLMENQITYCVLNLRTSPAGSAMHELFKITIEGFIDTVTDEYDWLRSENEGRKSLRQRGKEEEEPAHLLNLLQARLAVGGQEGKIHGLFHRINGYYMVKKHRGKHVLTLPNVKELREAGIGLRPSETRGLVDISFSRQCFMGKLHLPCIVVNDTTGAKFMNLVAYEMSPEFKGIKYVTSYICFLNCLIARAEDVKALREAEYSLIALAAM